MLNSSIRKIKTLTTDGIEPFEVGLHNFEKHIEEVEILAKERSKTCEGCRFYKIEPIPFLRVTDHRIPALSDMSCGKCGCILSYKTRQSIKICSKWTR